MSQENLDNLFAFQSDNDDKLTVSLPPSSKVLGLNQGITATSVEYRAKNQQGQDAPSISIELADSEGGKLFYNIYGNIQVYDSNNQVRTDVNTDSYKKKYAEEFAQVKAVLTHFATKAIGPEAYESKYKEFLAAGKIKNVADLMQFAASAITKLVENQVVLDVFLQYQWNIKGDNTKTFLELPKNLKSGPFLAASTLGTTWTEIKDKDGLRYVDANGAEHVFKRRTSWLDQPSAKQQTKSSGSDLDAAASAAMVQGNGTTNQNWL